MANTPLKIRVKAARVLDESNEASDSDEPYIIVFVAKVGEKQFGFTLPNAKTTHYSWGDADEGELLTTMMKDEIPAALKGVAPFFSGSDYCWGPNGKATPIDDPDDLIILAGVMENDDGSPSAARSVVNGIMAGSLANMIAGDMSRSEMVDRLRQDMGGALTQARMTGAPDFDDRVGPVKEVRLTHELLDKAAKGSAVKNVTFNGGDSEGAYRFAFEIKRG